MITVFTTEKKPNLDFLTNSSGEPIASRRVSSVANSWYVQLSDTKFLQYLVTKRSETDSTDAEYGIWAVIEIEHPEDEQWAYSANTHSPEWGKATSDQIWNHLKNAASELDAVANQFGYEVYLGKKTGNFGRHEICVFVPMTSSEEQYASFYNKVKDIQYEF